MAEIKQEVTQALSTLALSRATDPKMKPVTTLLQDPNWLNVDGGAAYGSYQGVAAQSGGVIGTLKSIRSTLMDQKQASIEKENDSQRQYEIAKESKEADLKRSKDEKAEKEGTLEECNAKIEECNAKIKQATADIADANKYIGKLLKDRDAFSKEFDSRSAMRSQEMAATQAALDALQEVTAGAKSAVEGVLLQKSSSLGVKCKRCGVAAKRLRAVGRKYHERSLVQLAASLENRLHSTARDPAAYFDPSAMDPD